jgi:serine/threonine protein phosphatase PrpC
MREARLFGRDHTRYGFIASVAEGPVAIALSAGGARKTYDHTDPNEDAVGFAWGPDGALLVVADAHNGSTASEAIIGHLLDGPGQAWVHGAPLPDWRATALGVLWDAHIAVRRAVEYDAGPNSRTTLVLALVRPEEGRVRIAAVGDSHAFAVSHDTRDLAEPGAPTRPRYWLGSEPLTEDDLAEKAVVQECDTAGLRALVLATDGLSEKHVGVSDPAAAVTEAAALAAAEAPHLRALGLARNVARRAQDAHLENPSGDNVGVAAIWLDT